MKNYFYELSSFINGLIKSDELFLLNITGESSDFTRFNHARIRHGGHVDQYYLQISMIKNKKKISHSLSLSIDFDADKSNIDGVIKTLRHRMQFLPEDPYLLFSMDPVSSEDVREIEVPDTCDALLQILEEGKHFDLVGIYASGSLCRGFSNSLGQLNWFESSSFNLDFSIYHEKDKAVKAGYAGFEWNEARLREKIRNAKEQLDLMSRDAVSISPGGYNVYLSPNALSEIVKMMIWKGFGARRRHTRSSSLNQMIHSQVRLDPSVSIRENTKNGFCGKFQEEGFIKPDVVKLIERGELKDSLVSPRSALEFGIPCNGASPYEFAESIEILSGVLDQLEILDAIETGVYINNLHYLNYSDLNAARITGLTRFAAFWVENGKIVAPVNVMRFDETIYHIFGKNLIGLTKDRELILSSNTYNGRDTESCMLPGAVVRDFRFTL